MILGPSASWYEPPEPPLPCCALAEDEPDHDTEACLKAQEELWAEQNASRIADRVYDEMQWRGWDE